MVQQEITVFTEGDATHPNVWSNIPYFLTTTLESKGYLVHRVDVSGNRIFSYLYDKIICRLLRKTIKKNTSFNYSRSGLYQIEVNHKMKKAVTQYPDSCCYISTSFSYTPYLYTVKPAILFCDWTYDYYVRHFLQREPDSLETQGILRQNVVLEHASAIIVLFPDVAESMLHTYKNQNIYYLGNVINAEPYTCDLSSLSHRQADANILFIGLPKYKEGVLTLIKAVMQLRVSMPSISLTIIGMTNKDLPNLPDYIHCYGYLDKTIATEKGLYYALIDHAAVYVNTTPIWAGFSSALEALHHYVPVITTPYESFIKTFGDEIGFGYYCHENTTDRIVSDLHQILTLTPAQYSTMCQCAHMAVKEFTWDTYVENLIHHIKK